MFILNEKPLALDVPFTHNGVQYPANWLRLTTFEEKQAIGITEEPDPIIHDQRYYWDIGIPKQLEDETVTTEDGRTYIQTGLKTQHITQTKETANTLLQPTDWYIIRSFERGIDVPVGVATYRAAVISVADEREELISAATTVEELKALYESSANGSAMPSWPSLENI